MLLQKQVKKIGLFSIQSLAILCQCWQLAPEKQFSLTKKGENWILLPLLYLKLWCKIGFCIKTLPSLFLKKLDACIDWCGKGSSNFFTNFVLVLFNLENYKVVKKSEAFYKTKIMTKPPDRPDDSGPEWWRKRSLSTDPPPMPGLEQSWSGMTSPAKAGAPPTGCWHAAKADPDHFKQMLLSEQEKADWVRWLRCGTLTFSPFVPFASLSS